MAIIDTIQDELEQYEDPRVVLDKDLLNSSVTLTKPEVQYLVSLYYRMQDNRKAAANQMRSLQDEPHDIFKWVFSNARRLEDQVQRSMKRYAENDPMCVWAMKIPGIGPVLSAGLAAHIDISKAPTVGHIWSFAGLDPSITWEKGQKRPWNAELKTLCWKIGECFVKVCNREKDIYGHIYTARRQYEHERNEAGEYKDQADTALKRIGKTTKAYKSYIKGKLPDGHLHARAKRYAVKLFLSHWHHVAYSMEHGKAPPNPFVIEHLGHTHFVPVPFWDDSQKV